MILRGGRLSERVPYLVGVLQTMKWVTAFTLRREQKGNLCSTWGKPKWGILSHWKSKCARPKGRCSRQLQVAKYVKSTMNVKLRKEKTNIISKCFWKKCSDFVDVSLKTSYIFKHLHLKMHAAIGLWASNVQIKIFANTDTPAQASNE